MRFTPIVMIAVALLAAPGAGHAVTENFRCSYDSREVNETRNANLAVMGLNVRADRTEYMLWESKIEQDKQKRFLKLARLFISGPNERKLFVLWHGATGEGATAMGYGERVLMEPEEADKLLATLEGAAKLDPRQEALFCSEGGLAVSLSRDAPAVFAFYNAHSAQFTTVQVPWGDELAALIAGFRRLTKGP